MSNISDKESLNSLEKELLRQIKFLNESQRIAKIGSWELCYLTNEVTWSDECYKVCGLDKDTKSRYKTYLSLVCEEDREYVHGEILKALKTGVYPTIYHRIVTPNGELKHILSKGDVEKDDKGKLLKISGTLQDITSLKAHETELKDKTAQLERKNQSLEQFANTASHDLNEPLRKISTFTYMIKDENLSKEKRKVFIDKIESAAIRMQQLINNVLDFSRIEVDNKPSNRSIVDLNEIISNLLCDMEVSINDQKAIIKVGKLPKIFGIEGQLTQLFQNLISNSLKFHKAENPPEIEISCKSLKGYELSDRSKDALIGSFPKIDDIQLMEMKFAKIIIKDNGIGFEQEYSNKIFELFERLNGKIEYSGTGIGLSICKRVVDNHNGIIIATSEINKGAEFRIIIPIL